MVRTEARRAGISIFAVLACLFLGGIAAASAAPPARKAGPPRISLSVPATVGSKGVVVATGRVTPAPVRGHLVIQFRKGEGWRSFGHGPLRRGRFALAGTLPQWVGVTRVRALLFEGRRRLASSSARVVHVRRRRSRPLPPGPVPPSPLPAPEDPLSATSLMATVQSYASLPNHLSGTANSAQALAEISGALAAAGLRLGQQPFTYPGFLPGQVTLSAGSTTVPSAALAPLLYSGKTPSGGVTGQLFDGGNGVYDKTKVKGKIVVVSISYQNNARPVNLESAIEAAVEGEAVGLVAVTLGAGNYPKWQDTNARTGTGPLPVLMVGKRSGEAVVEAAENEENGTLVLTAGTPTACDRDVWGELEGAEPNRRVFVGVPASSFTPAAAEHGAGVAILLGLARYYAALPKSQRPETLVFIAVGGHEIGWLGLQTLINSSYGSWLTGADAYVHLGSFLGAPTIKEEAGGEIVTVPEPDPSGALHNSENALIEPAVREDFAAAGVPTKNVAPFVASGGEQTYAYAAGIPIASFSGAGLYFHTAGDLASTLDPAILAADAEAFRRTIDTIAALAPGQLRAANTLATQHGTEINPAQRAPTNPTLGSPKGSLGEGGVGGPPATPVAECP